MEAEEKGRARVGYDRLMKERLPGQSWALDGIALLGLKMFQLDKFGCST